MSITRQYAPDGLSRTVENLELMRLPAEQYTRTPFYGVRKMGLEAIYAEPRLSVSAPGHRIYPYPLQGLPIVRPDQVWGADITCMRMRLGFAYLAAIMGWYSRYVLCRGLSVTLDLSFRVAALVWALRSARPEIFNSDPGSQFTG